VTYFRTPPQKCVGGIQNQAFRTPKIKEYLYLPKSLCERPSSETPGAIDSFSIFQNSSFDQYPSSPTELPNELRITQGVRVSVRLTDFFRDETPGANLMHPGSLGLGFPRGLSSFLTANDFKFGCDSLFQVTKGARRKGNLQKIEGFLPIGARDESKKGAAICGVTS
jgi:hypothetical protein